MARAPADDVIEAAQRGGREDIERLIAALVLANPNAVDGDLTRQQTKYRVELGGKPVPGGSDWHIGGERVILLGGRITRDEVESIHRAMLAAAR